MRAWLLSCLVAGASSLGASELLLTLGAWRFDDIVVQRVVLGSFLCAVGGLVAFLTPVPGVERQDMTFRNFLRLVGLGAIFGIPTTHLLYAARFDAIDAARPYLILAAGILAFPTAVLIKQLGPLRLLRLLLGRIGVDAASSPPANKP